MATIYSTRFLQTRGGNKTVTVTVPPAKRAVIRCVTAMNFSTTESNYALFVAGTAVLFWVSRTAYSTQYVDVRLVAYAGEDLKLSIEGPDMAVHISGYLLDEAVGRSLELDAIAGGELAGIEGEGA
jgi:hypothetical protein